MSEARHTPGPWAQYEDDPLIIMDDKGSSLGKMVPGDPYISHDEALANARLIAAAPDMLEALRDIVAIADRETFLVVAIADRETEPFIRARAVIAKAEGAVHD